MLQTRRVAVPGPGLPRVGGRDAGLGLQGLDKAPPQRPPPTRRSVCQGLGVNLLPNSGAEIGQHFHFRSSLCATLGQLRCSPGPPEVTFRDVWRATVRQLSGKSLCHNRPRPLQGRGWPQLGEFRAETWSKLGRGHPRRSNFGRTLPESVEDPRDYACRWQRGIGYKQQIRVFVVGPSLRATSVVSFPLVWRNEAQLAMLLTGLGGPEVSLCLCNWVK